MMRAGGALVGINGDEELAAAVQVAVVCFHNLGFGIQDSGFGTAGHCERSEAIL
jgi:hypothetical protein